MTIVAGFDFNDGVLVCADTEMTDSVQKFQSSKMKLYSIGGGSSGLKPLRLVFALAGSVSYAERAIALCEAKIANDHLAKPDKITNETIQTSIEESLLEFHEKFVFNHPLYRDGGAPAVELIIGLWPPATGRASLLCTRECAVNEVRGFDFVGLACLIHHS